MSKVKAKDAHIEWPGCSRCKSPRVHRYKRTFSQKIFSFLIPVRPVRCASCGTVDWCRLPLGHAPLNYLVALCAWGGALTLGVFGLPPYGHDENLLGRLVAGMDRAGQRQIELATEFENALSDLSPSIPRMEGAKMDAASAVASPQAGAVAAPAPSLETVVADHRQNRLLAIDVDLAGTKVTVKLIASESIESQKMTRSAAASAYILDIHGDWSLAEAIRRDTLVDHHNMWKISVGKHKEFLRVVFRLRDMAEDSLKFKRIENGMKIWIS